VINAQNDLEKSKYIHANLPKEGLFAGKSWRISPQPFELPQKVLSQIHKLGPILFDFYRACDLLYGQSVKGLMPSWIHEILDLGKPKELIEVARSHHFTLDLPRVIRPDILMTSQDSFVITELDSVPGGIGLTTWLYSVYKDFDPSLSAPFRSMLDGFKSIFEKEQASIVFSKESQDYQPEMSWMIEQIKQSGYPIRMQHLDDCSFSNFSGSLYRFFELFDFNHEPNIGKLIQHAIISNQPMTPPVKPWLEEKMLFAFFWMKELQDFWNKELGNESFAMLQKIFPLTWIVDPSPLSRQDFKTDLNIQYWQDIARFSQKERQLVLKVSGFSPQAWGARGVYVGHDMSASNWGQCIERACKSYFKNPYILQKFHKALSQEVVYFDCKTDQIKSMKGRARICPFFFVQKQMPLKVTLSGALATICPADKKILHGMSSSIMAPCFITNQVY
jgi:hypothetical protein